MLRRGVVIGSLMLLGACAIPNGTGQEPLPYVVRGVTVDTSNVKVQSGFLGENVGKTPAEVNADVTSALQQALSVDPANGTANVTIKVTEVFLISRIEAAVPFADSFVTSDISVTDASTGQDLVEPFTFKAGAPEFRGAGVVGIVLAPDVDKDYAETVIGYARAVRKRLADGKDE